MTRKIKKKNIKKCKECPFNYEKNCDIFCIRSDSQYISDCEGNLIKN